MVSISLSTIRVSARLSDCQCDRCRISLMVPTCVTSLHAECRIRSDLTLIYRTPVKSGFLGVEFFRKILATLSDAGGIWSGCGFLHTTGRLELTAEEWEHSSLRSVWNSR